MPRLRSLVLIVLLAAQLGFAQATAPQQPQNPQPANPNTPTPQITPGDANHPPKAKIEITVPAPPDPQTAPAPKSQPTQPGAPASSQTTPAAKPGTEQRMSQAQADELFKSVDEILQWVSQETGLPIKTPVKRKLASRQEVEKFVSDKMTTDEDAKRLERSVIVLKKFGLVPRDFDLGAFMVKLLGEQVVGYYDPKTKTVYLLDWVEPEEQKPVLAHELTHALQDQNFDLDKWMRAGEPENAAEDLIVPSDPKVEQAKLQAQVDKDELQSARQAVSEGQGMVSLIDFSLAPMKRSLADSPPAVLDALTASMGQGTDSPIFSRAPVFLREVLTFPYTYGLKFEGTLLASKGKQAAFTNALAHPPNTTRDIMEPQQYLKNEQIRTLRIPPVGNLIGSSWEKLDVGAMGEFDVFLLLDQYANHQAAQKLAPAWRGGYYYAALKKSADKPKRELKTSDVSLFYVSRWADEPTAREFADTYARSFLTRYRDVWPKKKENGRDMLWDTNEGAMLVQQVGDTVIVSESFEAKLALRLRDAALEAARNAPQVTPE